MVRESVESGGVVSWKNFGKSENITCNRISCMFQEPIPESLLRYLTDTMGFVGFEQAAMISRGRLREVAPGFREKYAALLRANSVSPEYLEVRFVHPDRTQNRQKDMLLHLGSGLILRTSAHLLHLVDFSNDPYIRYNKERKLLSITSTELKPYKIFIQATEEICFKEAMIVGPKR